MNGNKEDRLDYIEDHQTHHLDHMAKLASAKAVEEAQEAGIPITILEGGKIVQVSSDGSKETIGFIDESRRKVQVGDRTTL